MKVNLDIFNRENSTKVAIYILDVITTRIILMKVNLKSSFKLSIRLNPES